MLYANKFKRAVLVIGAVVVSLTWPLVANTQNPVDTTPGIEERLGSIIPGDIQLRDEQGRAVRLGDLLDKPTILNLGYFKCPGICSPLLSSLIEAVRGLDLQPGVDYQIITVSIDYTEGPELAREKKRNYLHSLPDFPPEQWPFLTGDSLNIDRLTRAVGFLFNKKGKDIAHPAAIVALSPEGKICRYIYGTEFLPFDLKMALLESSKGKIGPSVARVLKFCFSYDPQGRKYVFNLLRVVGVGILISSLGFVALIAYLSRKTG